MHLPSLVVGRSDDVRSIASSSMFVRFNVGVLNGFVGCAFHGKSLGGCLSASELCDYEPNCIPLVSELPAEGVADNRDTASRRHSRGPSTQNRGEPAVMPAP